MPFLTAPGKRIRASQTTNHLQNFFRIKHFLCIVHKTRTNTTMKKILFSGLVLALCIVTAVAQKVKEADVPAAVKAGFKTSFPSAKVEKWEKEGADYEAEFDMGKSEYSAVFSADGILKETEQEIAVKDLPAAVTQTLKTKYPKAKVTEAAIITDSKGAKTYEAEIKGKDLIFDATGNLIKEEKDEKGDKEKKD